MSYIVKNCPSIISLYKIYQCALTNNYYCQDCTDCVIKQVIDMCLEQNLKYDTTACEILQLFDIEEINK